MAECDNRGYIKMSETTTIALITSILSAGVAIATIIFSHVKDKYNSRIQIVTIQRIEWLDILRKEIAEYISLAQKCFYCGVLQKATASLDDGKKFLDVSSETVALGYKLLLRLNPIENETIITTIKKLNKSVSGNEIKVEAKEFMSYLDSLVELSHTVLKQEWEKVKKEAGYKKPARVRACG
jgi:hypothetical protein